MKNRYSNKMAFAAALIVSVAAANGHAKELGGQPGGPTYLADLSTQTTVNFSVTHYGSYTGPDGAPMRTKLSEKRRVSLLLGITANDSKGVGPIRSVVVGCTTDKTGSCTVDLTSIRDAYKRTHGDRKVYVYYARAESILSTKDQDGHCVQANDEVPTVSAPEVGSTDFFVSHEFICK